MIKAIISGLIQLIINLVNIFLTPINALINQFMPSLNNAFNAIGSFLNICVSSIGWVISALGIPPVVIELIIAFYTFKLTVPLLVHAVKLVVKWYRALMP